MLQQCIHPPNSVFVHMNEEPPLHLADASDTPTQAHQETGVCPYLHVKLGELTRLSFVVEDKQCPSSHRRATQSLWQRKHAQYFSFFPWTRTLAPTRSVPIPNKDAATATLQKRHAALQPQRAMQDKLLLLRKSIPPGDATAPQENRDNEKAAT